MRPLVLGSCLWLGLCFSAHWPSTEIAGVPFQSIFSGHWLSDRLAAAAKSLQSCLTLCDPIDGSLPGLPVPGILQARTLEWVAISFSNAWKWKVKVKSLSRVWLLSTPWTAAHQAPPSIDFPGKSTGVGCHCLLCSHRLSFSSFISQEGVSSPTRPGCMSPGRHSVFLIGRWLAWTGDTKVTMNNKHQSFLINKMRSLSWRSLWDFFQF